MISTTLETHLGLTPNEAKVYYILLKHQPKTINRIAVLGNLHRRNIYDTLAKLQHKGLVSEEINTNGSFYSAVHPEKFRELLEEKNNAIESVMPEMEQLFDSNPTEQKMYMYRGIAGFKNYLSDILKQKSMVRSLGAKGEWHDPQIREFMLNFWQEKHARGIESRILFDHSAHEVGEIPKYLSAESYKFLPSSMQTESVVEIFEDRIVMFSNIGPKYIAKDIVLHIIESKTLAASYQKWFDYLWSTV